MHWFLIYLRVSYPVTLNLLFQHQRNSKLKWTFSIRNISRAYNFFPWAIGFESLPPTFRIALWFFLFAINQINGKSAVTLFVSSPHGGWLTSQRLPRSPWRTPPVDVWPVVKATEPVSRFMRTNNKQEFLGRINFLVHRCSWFPINISSNVEWRLFPIIRQIFLHSHCFIKIRPWLLNNRSAVFNI